jgi:hypothetical protein
VNVSWFESLDPFGELRMVLAIGQQPDVFICVDGKPVAPCVNVDVSANGMIADVNAEYTPTSAMVADGMMLRLPSGMEFFVAFTHLTGVNADDKVIIRGTIRIEAN